MSIAATVRAMADTGCTAAQIAAAVEAWEASERQKQNEAILDMRAKAAERQRRSRASRNVTDVTSVTVTSVTDPSPPYSPPSPSPDPNPNPPYNPPQPVSSSSPDVRALERECRQIVGGEPVALAQDFPALAAVLDEGVTPDDVISGVRAAMAAPTFRPRSWAQFANWARRAGKDRLAVQPKVVGFPQARGSPPEKPQRYTMFDAYRDMMAEAENG